jgi:hypothetical protein
MHNFMLDDLFASTQAFLVFALFLVPPGYVTGTITDVIGFRTRSVLEKLLLAIVLSVCVAPGLAVLVGRFASVTVSLWMFVSIAIVFVFVFISDPRCQDKSEHVHPCRSTIIAAALVSSWVIIAISQLIDWQIGNRLYPSVVSFDASLRADFIQACLRTGVPPLNPYFFAHGSAPVMRYFYYWYVLCALPAKLAHVSGRASLIASSAWCGIAIAAVTVLFLKHFLEVKERLRRVSLYAIALLAVTGLDLFFIVSRHWVPPDMEWWDTDQVTSWFDALLWVPHHVASLIACLGAFLVLWVATQSRSTRPRIAAVFVAGLGFSTAAGLSVYVVFAFAIFMVLWTLSLIIEKRWADFAMCILAGVGALIFALPYLHDLRGPGASGGGFAAVHVPLFVPLVTWLVREGLVQSEFGLLLWRIPMLMLHYVFELGFFLIVLAVRWKRDRHLPRSRVKTASWLMLASSFVVASFLRSAVIRSNDLGWRGAMMMQFILLLWAAILLDEFVFTNSSNSMRSRILLTTACAVAILVGASGSIFQILVLRTYVWMSDHGKVVAVSWLPQPPAIGERTYEIRSMFEALDRKIAVSAIVQNNPFTQDFGPFHLYSTHQFAAGDSECGDAFGGDPRLCRETVGALNQIYRTAATLQAEDLNQFCDDFQIDVLIAQDRDPAWQVSNSWVWTRIPLASAQHIRAIPCGTGRTN